MPVEIEPPPYASQARLPKDWCHAVLDVHQDRQGAEGVWWEGV